MIYFATIISLIGFVLGFGSAALGLVKQKKYLGSLLGKTLKGSQTVAANDATFRHVGVVEPIDPARVLEMLAEIKVVVAQVVEKNPAKEKLRNDGQQVVRSVEEFSNDLETV